jgi:hypothetical protein
MHDGAVNGVLDWTTTTTVGDPALDTAASARTRMSMTFVRCLPRQQRVGTGIEPATFRR